MSQMPGVLVQVVPSAQLDFQARDAGHTMTEADLPRGTVWMPVHAYPRVGDEFAWGSGENYTVKYVTWIIDGDKPPGDWAGIVTGMLVTLD